MLILIYYCEQVYICIKFKYYISLLFKYFTTLTNHTNYPQQCSYNIILLSTLSKIKVYIYLSQIKYGLISNEIDHYTLDNKSHLTSIRINSIERCMCVARFNH